MSDIQNLVEEFNNKHITLVHNYQDKILEKLDQICDSIGIYNTIVQDTETNKIGMLEYRLSRWSAVSYEFRFRTLKKDNNLSKNYTTIWGICFDDKNLEDKLKERFKPIKSELNP